MKKYQEIFNDLQEKIMNGGYQPGSLLPTENDLQDQYGVSRDSVRKALRLLTEKGLIQKVQGRGSQVLKQELLNFPVSGLTSYKELVDSLHLDSKTQVVSLDSGIIDQQESERTGFDVGTQVWKILRTRTIDGVISVLDLDYLSKTCVPYITKEIAEDSIYNYLENKLGLAISFAQKEITIQASTERERLLMKNQDEYLVLIRSRVYLSDTKQFQYTESRHKIDKFQFVDFARRKNSL